jgi:hypothetical protein
MEGGDVFGSTISSLNDAKTATRVSETAKCRWCGVAIKPWTDRYVDMAGGELCQDGGQVQFARRHEPAEATLAVPELPQPKKGRVAQPRSWKEWEKERCSDHPWSAPISNGPTQLVCYVCTLEQWLDEAETRIAALEGKRA